VRIGLYTGEAIKEGDDFFGKNVIPAARIAGQALCSEILVSSLLKETDGQRRRIRFRRRARGRAEGTLGNAPRVPCCVAGNPPRGQGAGSRAGRRGLIFSGCAAKNPLSPR